MDLTIGDPLLIACAMCGVSFEAQSIVSKCPECGVRGELVAVSAAQYNSYCVKIGVVTDAEAKVLAARLRHKMLTIQGNGKESETDLLEAIEECDPRLLKAVKAIVGTSSGRLEIYAAATLVLAILTWLGISPQHATQSAPRMMLVQPRYAETDNKRKADSELLPDTRIHSRAIKQDNSECKEHEPPRASRTKKDPAKGKSKIKVRKKANPDRVRKR